MRSLICNMDDLQSYTAVGFPRFGWEPLMAEDCVCGINIIVDFFISFGSILRQDFILS